MGDLQGPLLITGGLGYVGGRVATYLRQCYPTLPIRLMTRRHRSSATWATDFQVAEGDILDSASLRRALEGVSTVIHLAASNEIESARDPARALYVTSKGTLKLLQVAQEAGASRFVYMSTFHVYGASTGGLITEETLPGPSHPYAITHYTAEQFVAMFQMRGALETLTLRLSNSYGAPMDLGVDRWTLVFNDLCHQAAEHGRLVLASSGRPQRDFISLSDIGRAVQHFLAMASGTWGDGLFNLGGECSMSILELANHISHVYEAQCGKSLPITTGDGDSPDSWHSVRFSIEKLKSTGFAPKHNLEEEIVRTLALCKSH